MSLSFLKDIVGLGAGAAGIYSAFRDTPENPYLEEAAQDAAERRRFRQMAMNPNDPEFLNMVKIDEEATRNDFVKAMSEALRRQNRAQARGQVMTRPERQDEFFNKMQARLTSGPEARQRVQSKLLTAAGQPNYGPLIAGGAQQNLMNEMNMGARLSAPFKMADSLIDFWGRNQPKEVPQDWVGVRPGRKPDYQVWEG